MFKCDARRIRKYVFWVLRMFNDNANIIKRIDALIDSVDVLMIIDSLSTEPAQFKLEELKEAVYKLRDEYKLYQRTLRYNNELSEALLVEIRNQANTKLADKIAKRYK